MAHDPIFIYPYYTLLGLANRVLHRDPFFVFHMGSILANIVLILVLYHLIGQFTHNKFHIFLLLIQVLLGGGLGWIGYFQSFSADTSIPDFTLLKSLTMGHDGLTVAFLLLGQFYTYKYITETKRVKFNFSIAQLAIFLSIIFHPFVLLIFLAQASINVLIKREALKKFIVFVGTLLIIFVAYIPIGVLPLLTNPGWSGFINSQLPKVNLLSVLAGTGIFLPLVVVFFISREPKATIIKVFIVLHLVLMYLPLSFSSEFNRGLFFWLVLGGYYGLMYVCKNKKLLSTLLIGVTILSTFTSIYIWMNLLFRDKRRDPFMFLSNSEGQALEFMNKFPSKSGLISYLRIGNYIPAFTDNRVFFGHIFTTPSGVEKAKLVEDFYIHMSPEEQREFAQKNSITYIYYGYEEMHLREAEHLSTHHPFGYFPKVFTSGEVIIYALH